ncbi:ABC transporter ATP-binding protein [Desulfitobacterium sp. Sab5]|uniref:ABC transporter ATP-binding protein n=1 Tax=Desulfitobacterium nosdiversum TaxID=3375356 RepID=UPI003CF27445
MIHINHVTMDYRIQKEHIRSFKEYLVSALKGKVTYESFRAIDDIDLFIKKGEVCGIIGRNGAGKSTLLKMIAGVLTPTKGNIKIEGTIAPMLELGAGFDHDLTARENIYLNGAILGYSRKFLESKYDEIVSFAELENFIENPVRTFSSGMIMRLAFSIATLVEPEVLIIDEILSVGDAHFQKKSGDRMKQLINGGTTVLMVSHSNNQIREMCSRVIWLEHGKVIMDGDAEKVCTAYEAKE